MFSNLVFKKINPVTPSMRRLKLLNKSFLWKKKSIKLKTLGWKNKAGRNHHGCITSFHRGGGHKKLYRVVDFKRIDSYGIVEGFEHDPFRNVFLARIFNPLKKTHFYILAPKNLFPGSLIVSGSNAQIKIGHSLPLSQIPVGTLIHNVAVKYNGEGQIARAAGTYAQVIQKIKNYARIRLCSNEQRLIPLNAIATLGVVANENWKLISLGKAGRARKLNRRPIVRGVAMNPIDHPHGGGEGKTSGGRPSVTPWGKPTKGPKTSRSKNRLVVVPRFKKKK
jgi:large subunit ribosomal protein L2